MINSASINKIMLTMTEAGAFIGCGYSTIQKLVKQGKLRATKRNRTYYVFVEDLEHYVRSLYNSDYRR